MLEPLALSHAAREQGWRWSNCKYEREDQEKLADEVVSDLYELAYSRGPKSGAPPTQSFFDVFEGSIEKVLQVACQIKHSKFSEEWEWRFISPYMERLADDRIGYTERGPLLVPYAEFVLGDLAASDVIREVIVGPTAHQDLNVAAIDGYLSGKLATVRVCRSSVPYRVI